MFHVTTTVTLTFKITATLTTLKRLYLLNLQSTVDIKSYVPSILRLKSHNICTYVFPTQNK
jgi:hypothetical protein